MIDKLIEQQEQIKAMQENEDSAIKVMKMYEECKKRINKTIKYIRSNEWAIDYEHSNCRTHLLEILEGRDKE